MFDKPLLFDLEIPRQVPDSVGVAVISGVADAAAKVLIGQFLVYSVLDFAMSEVYSMFTFL